MTQLVDATKNQLRDFTGSSIDSPIDGPEWLQTIRAAARAGFAERGFPTRRDEEWRYTPVAAIAETDFQLASGPAEVSADQIAAYSLTALGGTQLVFVNGAFVPHL
jgi:Fe-S cluster assembly protein SufD